MELWIERLSKYYMLLVLDLIYDIWCIIDSKLIQFLVPWRVSHLYENFIFHNFFCSFQALVSSKFLYVTAIKETYDIWTF